jgi:hypothetical protein
MGWIRRLSAAGRAGFFAHLTEPMNIQALGSTITAAPHPVALERA